MQTVSSGSGSGFTDISSVDENAPPRAKIGEDADEDKRLLSQVMDVPLVEVQVVRCTGQQVIVDSPYDDACIAPIESNGVLVLGRPSGYDQYMVGVYNVTEKGIDRVFATKWDKCNINILKQLGRVIASTNNTARRCDALGGTAAKVRVHQTGDGAIKAYTRKPSSSPFSLSSLSSLVTRARTPDAPAPITIDKLLPCVVACVFGKKTARRREKYRSDGDGWTSFYVYQNASAELNEELKELNRVHAQAAQSQAQTAQTEQAQTQITSTQKHQQGGRRRRRGQDAAAFDIAPPFGGGGARAAGRAARMSAPRSR